MPPPSSSAQREASHYHLQTPKEAAPDDSRTEHVNQAKKRDADLKIPALLQSNAALAEPMQIPGFNYLEIKVTGRNFERFLLSQLSWWDFT
jgi:hypothetical protein